MPSTTVSSVDVVLSALGVVLCLLAAGQVCSNRQVREPMSMVIVLVIAFLAVFFGYGVTNGVSVLGVTGIPSPPLGLILDGPSGDGAAALRFGCEIGVAVAILMCSLSGPNRPASIGMVGMTGIVAIPLVWHWTNTGGWMCELGFPNAASLPVALYLAGLVDVAWRKFGAAADERVPQPTPTALLAGSVALIAFVEADASAAKTAIALLVGVVGTAGHIALTRDRTWHAVTRALLPATIIVGGLLAESLAIIMTAVALAATIFAVLQIRFRHDTLPMGASVAVAAAVVIAVLGFTASEASFGGAAIGLVVVAIAAISVPTVTALFAIAPADEATDAGKPKPSQMGRPDTAASLPSPQHIDESLTQITALEEELAVLHEVNRDLAKEMADERERAADLQSALDDRDATLEARSRERATLEDELVDAQDSFSTISTELVARNERIAELERNANQLEEAAATAASRIDELQMELSRRRDAVEASQEPCSQCDSAAEGRERALADRDRLEEENAALQSDLSAQSEARSSAEAELDASRKSVDRLGVENTKLIKRVESVEAENGELVEERDALLASRAAEREEHAQAERRWQTERDAARAVAEELQEQLASADAEQRRLREQIAELQLESGPQVATEVLCEQQRQQIQRLMSELAAARDHLHNAPDSPGNLRQEVDRLKQLNAQLQSELHAMQATADKVSVAAVEPSGSAAIIDEDELLELCMNDVELTRDLLIQLRDELPHGARAFQDALSDGSAEAAGEALQKVAAFAEQLPLYQLREAVGQTTLAVQTSDVATLATLVPQLSERIDETLDQSERLLASLEREPASS